VSLGKVTKRLYSLIMHLVFEHNVRARLKVLIFFNQDEKSKLLKEIFDVTSWSAI